MPQSAAAQREGETQAVWRCSSCQELVCLTIAIVVVDGDLLLANNPQQASRIDPDGVRAILAVHHSLDGRELTEGAA